MTPRVLLRIEKKHIAKVGSQRRQEFLRRQLMRRGLRRHAAIELRGHDMVTT